MSTTAQASMANSSTWARMRDKGCSVSRAKIPPGYAHESVSSMRASPRTSAVALMAEGRHERLVLASRGAEAVGDGGVATGELEGREKVVDAAEGGARGCANEEPLELADGLGAHLRVETAEQDHRVARLSVSEDGLQDLRRGLRAAMPTAAVHTEGAVVVHEEDGLPACLVTEARPLHAARAGEFGSLIDGHHLGALGKQLPGGGLEGDGQRVRTLDVAVLLVELAVDEHLRHVLAVLQRHEVRGRGHDEADGTAECSIHGGAVAALPLEVEGQGFDVQRLTTLLADKALAFHWASLKDPSAFSSRESAGAEGAGAAGSLEFLRGAGLPFAGSGAGTAFAASRWRSGDWIGTASPPFAMCAGVFPAGLLPAEPSSTTGCAPGA
eukprot:CAMPEP_0177560934 /NCGR_PEP_ID=MMETSP0369-20130122/71651_1 /TAXON_ID=447022 ORGANISM="Scrippsiella hangoei-like, Strain SHHI-4" /NCGR_SAMPLE_ID=MMETSP0369 /ASSEMBLY_ACC=CAM_ASM_000364 /LENGTH=383 /DNA_ID=CAMNT_0019047797 /DNA_START=15 /DNA_END=1168 /DNA_ORIENTATION=+